MHNSVIVKSSRYFQVSIGCIALTCIVSTMSTYCCSKSQFYFLTLEMKDAKIMLNKTVIKINQEKRSVRQISTLCDWKCNELGWFFCIARGFYFSWSCGPMKMWTRLLTYMTWASIFLILLSCCRYHN